jgi:cytochrome c-type biogenesis protein CcmE
MKHKAVKIGITSVVLVLAFGGLLWSTLSEDTEYYKHVDEVMAAPAAWEGKRLQLHGFVKSKMLKPGTLEYLFQVENEGEIIWAQYTGVTPDTFKDDSEVVLKGQLARTEAGLLFQVEPNGIIAKCPSKYEARAGVGGAAAYPAAVTGVTP